VARPRRELHTIGFENWKGCSVNRELGIVGFWLLGKVEIELGRVNVLDAENGAAKANLLEALAFAAGMQ
jgi:AAA15 family ATPase/GTPase